MECNPGMKNIAIKLGLVLGSLSVGFLLFALMGEAYLRIQFGSASAATPFFVFHPERGAALKPGEYLHLDLLASRMTKIAINDLGIRGGPIQARVPRGKKRITVVGDSFMFGVALDEEETVSGQLEALMGDQYEVVNTGVPWFGTGQQLLLLDELVGKGYEIGDILVLAFFTNDIQDNLGLDYSTLKRRNDKPAFSVGQDGRLSHSPPVEKQRMSGKGSLAHTSLFYHFVRVQLESVAASYPGLLRAAGFVGLTPALPRIPGVVAGWYSNGWEERWTNTEAILTHFVHRIKEAHPDAEIRMVFIPSPFQIGSAFQELLRSQADANPPYRAFLDDTDRPQRKLEKFAQELRVPFVDPTKALREAPLAYFPREGHFNPTGSKLVAREIYESLSARE